MQTGEYTFFKHFVCTRCSRLYTFDDMTIQLNGITIPAAAALCKSTALKGRQMIMCNTPLSSEIKFVN